MTPDELQQVAWNIYLQLGGPKFKVMTSCTILALSDRPRGGLQVNFRGSKAANMMRVIVDDTDRYTVEFWNIKHARGMKAIQREYAKIQAGWKPQPVKVVEGCYAETLRDLFTETTGLETSLGTLGG